MKTQVIEVNTQAVNAQLEAIDHGASPLTQSIAQKIIGVAMHHAALTLAVAVLVLCVCNGTVMAQGPASILYAETPGQLFITGSNWVPVPGLTFTLPPAPASSATNPTTAALITLNLPNPYALATIPQGGVSASQ